MPAPGRRRRIMMRADVDAHIQSRGCLSTQSESEDERRPPLAVRECTREKKHANRAGGKETPVGESCEHVTKTNDRAAIGREMWFSFFVVSVLITHTLLLLLLHR